MSRVLKGGATAGKTAATLGPLEWMSPEAMAQNYSEKSDVWSYGCLLAEMLKGTSPFDHPTDLLPIAVKIRDEGLTPPLPEDAEPLLKSVAQACWKYDPAQRPSFEELLKLLGANAEDD